MRDYLTIGCSPVEEDCAQVGGENYAETARRECNAFRDQLRRQFGNEPDGARLAVKAFPHDFGTYYEVVCWYEDEASAEYAFRLEAETPKRWDDEARKVLGK